MRDRVFNLKEILGLSIGAATTMLRQAWHRLLGYSTSSCEARYARAKTDEYVSGVSLLHPIGRGLPGVIDLVNLVVTETAS